MNCKQGDLAIILESRAYPECIGWIVRVIAPYLHASPASDWEIEHAPLGRAGLTRTYTMDRVLRPIRDSEDPDETITWAGKPNETPVEIIQRETA